MIRACFYSLILAVGITFAAFICAEGLKWLWRS